MFSKVLSVVQLRTEVNFLGSGVKGQGPRMITYAVDIILHRGIRDLLL